MSESSDYDNTGTHLTDYPSAIAIAWVASIVRQRLHPYQHDQYRQQQDRLLARKPLY
ncbi:MAG: hypothetical protein ACXWPS_05610 [Ktedonobacteraceae bacterium]